MVLIVCLFVSFTMASSVYAESEEFTVVRTKEIVRTVVCVEGQEVTGDVVTYPPVGGIDFYVTDPDGETILRKDKATKTSFSFTASANGTYTLHFSNAFDHHQIVKLNYSVADSTPNTSRIGGRENLYLLAIVILIAIVIALSASLFLKRKSASISTKIEGLPARAHGKAMASIIAACVSHSFHGCAHFFTEHGFVGRTESSD